MEKKYQNLGVIDIGSNTILMTCAEQTPDRKLKVILECHDVARMSEGLQDDSPLQEEAKARVIATLTDFQKQAKKAGVHQLMAAGTAAFRRASDGEIFAQEIEAQLGFLVRILTPREEAHYSHLSAQNDFGTHTQSVGMVDIGGGSTELVWGSKEDQWVSLPVGTVRFLEKFVSQHPIVDAEWNKVKDEINKTLKALPYVPSPLGGEGQGEGFPKKWIAVAATPTALTLLLLEQKKFEAEKIHGYPIKISKLESIIEKLRTLSIEARQSLPGMQPKRAELLPIGGLILFEVMNYFSLKEVITSTRGLRYGILLENFFN